MLHPNFMSNPQPAYKQKLGSAKVGGGQIFGKGDGPRTAFLRQGQRGLLSTVERRGVAVEEGNTMGETAKKVS